MKGDVPAIPADQSGRLQFAEWLTGRSNPLTSRVMVNRVWHWLFGAGIVRTTDNFGSTGEAPSHPELLDYLAVKFMEEGWSLKKLVKEMVMSRTYRQSSFVVRASARQEGSENGLKPELQTDPDNRLLSHMNRKRLDAECIRDAMLVAAGTMETQFGGPNVGGAGKVDSNDQKIQILEYGFKFDDTRRSVYTAAFRNVRHPLFEVFDFADINQPIGQRTTSTVATQALFLMNSPMVIETARKLVDRPAFAELKSDEDRVTLLYLAIFQRWPSRQEVDLGLKYVASNPGGADVKLTADQPAPKISAKDAAKAKKAAATTRPASPRDPRPVGSAMNSVPTVLRLTTSASPKRATSGKVTQPAISPTAVSIPTTATASPGIPLRRSR
jgi:hypothetical protein